MAYENEKSKHIGYQNMVSNLSPMSKIIGDLKMYPPTEKYKRIDEFVIKDFQKSKDTSLKYLFVIDGSKHETEINKFGNDIAISLISVDQCVIDVQKMVKYLNDKFPLPNDYQKLKKDFIINSIIPLKGLLYSEMSDSKDLFRNTLFKIFEETTNPVVGFLKDSGYDIKEEESILDTYKNLVYRVPSNVLGNIQPCEKCKKLNNYMSIKKFKNDSNGINNTYGCSCAENKKEVYITDFLQFHEQLNSETSDNALTTQIMLVLEKLIMINLLRIIEKNNLKDLVKESVFVMDGTLAVYSHASWLSYAICDYIVNIKESFDLLMIGVEKTGHFVEHFKKIDSYFSDKPLEKGALFFLNDDYIKEHIKVYQNDSYYGEKNYFGKKLFYKNHANKLYVINLAFENEQDKFLNYNNRNEQESIDKCKRLQDLIMLLENFTSQAYPNALSFVSMANDGVSLSNSTLGKKLVSDLLEDLFKINN